MSSRLIFSPAAADDLLDVAEWLTQPGSGHRAHRKLDDLLDAIEALPEHLQQYPRDPDHPESRLAIIHGYAVRFQLESDGLVLVRRIFAPGRLR